MLNEIQVIEFIRENNLMAIPALNILGFAIKNTEIFNDKHIPLILIGIGMLLTIGTGGLNVVSVMQGILISTSAIGLHQAKRQNI